MFAFFFFFKYSWHVTQMIVDMKGHLVPSASVCTYTKYVFPEICLICIRQCLSVLSHEIKMGRGKRAKENFINPYTAFRWFPWTSSTSRSASGLFVPSKEFFTLVPPPLPPCPLFSSPCAMVHLSSTHLHPVNSWRPVLRSASGQQNFRPAALQSPQSFQQRDKCFKNTLYQSVYTVMEILSSVILIPNPFGFRSSVKHRRMSQFVLSQFVFHRSVHKWALSPKTQKQIFEYTFQIDLY